MAASVAKDAQHDDVVRLRIPRIKQNISRIHQSVTGPFLCAYNISFVAMNVILTHLAFAQLAINNIRKTSLPAKGHQLLWRKEGLHSTSCLNLNIKAECH